MIDRARRLQTTGADKSIRGRSRNFTTPVAGNVCVFTSPKNHLTAGRLWYSSCSIESKQRAIKRMNRNRLDATYQRLSTRWTRSSPLQRIAVPFFPETKISATDAAGGRPDRRQKTVHGLRFMSRPVSSIGQQLRRRAKQPATHVGFLPQKKIFSACCRSIVWLIIGRQLSTEPHDEGR
jgi:hypothetical protein